MADQLSRLPSVDEDFDAVAAPLRPRKPRTRRTEVQQKVEIIGNKPQSADPEPVVQEQQPTPVEVYFEQTEAEPTQEVADESSYEEPVQPIESATEPVRTSNTKQRSSKFKSRFSWELATIAVLLLVIVGLAVVSSQLHHDKTQLQAKVSSLEANPQIALQKQTDDLLKQVSALMTLPSGETPTVANVSDVTQARQQSPFFKDAQNGDKVLMYVKASEAILYRPTTNKIILVAPLTFNDTANATKN